MTSILTTLEGAGRDKRGEQDEREQGRERACWMECMCDVADDAGTLPFPSLPTSLTHTSTAESWLWAQPQYCRGERAAARV